VSRLLKFRFTRTIIENVYTDPARLRQHRPFGIGGDDSCQLVRESPPPFRQSGHAQPRADQLLRHRSKDRRRRRFCGTHRTAASCRILREVLALGGYDRDAKRFLIEPVFEVQRAAAWNTEGDAYRYQLPDPSLAEDCFTSLPIKNNEDAIA
jgi:hypothetical protein